MAMYNLLTLGGPIFWVIFGVGLLALGVFIERALSLHRARIRSGDFLKGVLNILTRGNTTEAIAICEDTPGPVAYIVRTAIQHRRAQKEDLIRTLDEASEAEISRMERRLAVIATVAQIAPLLGLLGTVLGMVDGFYVMRNQAPLIQSSDLMDCMFRALTTTAAGLMVAIPCYAMFNLLVIKIDRLVLDMERARTEMVAFLSDKFSRQGE